MASRYIDFMPRQDETDEQFRARCRAYIALDYDRTEYPSAAAPATNVYGFALSAEAQEKIREWFNEHGALTSAALSDAARRVQQKLPRPCSECHAPAVLLAEADSDGRCVYCHARRSEWRERGCGIAASDAVAEEYEEGDCWERPGAES